MILAARLRRSRDIAAVRSEGRAIRRASFVARIRRNDEGELRVAVVAPGSIGRAVHRNRMRRRVREAFRIAALEQAGPASADLLVTVRREADSAGFPMLRADAAGAIAEALR